MKTPIYVTGTPVEGVQESEGVGTVDGSHFTCPYCGDQIMVAMFENGGWELSDNPCSHLQGVEFPRESGVLITGDPYQPVRARYQWKPRVDEHIGSVYSFDAAFFPHLGQYLINIRRRPPVGVTNRPTPIAQVCAADLVSYTEAVKEESRRVDTADACEAFGLDKQYKIETDHEQVWVIPQQ